MCHPSPEHTQWFLQDSTAFKPDSASLSCPIKAAQPGTGAEMPPGYPAILAQGSQSFCRREKGGVGSRRTRPHECRPVARKKVLGQGSAFPPGRRAAGGGGGAERKGPLWRRRRQRLGRAGASRSRESSGARSAQSPGCPYTLTCGAPLPRPGSSGIFQPRAGLRALARSPGLPLIPSQPRSERDPQA